MSDDPAIALVTGASRGIGRAIAIELGNQGMTVIGTATTEQGADAISAYLAELKIFGSGLCADVSDDDSVSALIASVVEDFAAPLVLVNNAGITRDNLLMRMKQEEWSSVIDTNLGSMYRVTKACVKGMTRARWGRIVNISSVVGFKGYAGQAAYASSKHALAGFTKVLAKEVQEDGIKVHLVSPGGVNTEMVQEMRPDIDTSELIQPEEIAELVEFLVTRKGKGTIDHFYIRRQSGLAFD